MQNVCFSVPRVVRKDRICLIFLADLNKKKMGNFKKYADKIKGLIKDINF